MAPSGGTGWTAVGDGARTGRRWEHGPMRFDTQLAGLEDAPAHARRLEAMGVDGAFTFEGPHDVFTPLVLAAGAPPPWSWPPTWPSPSPATRCSSPTRPGTSSCCPRGRFTLGLGSQVRAQVEKRYGADFDRPIARMRELVGALRAIFATWETGERLDFRGEFTSHTLMPPMFNPGPHPYGPAADRPGRPRPPDGGAGRRGGRRAPGHALQHRRPLPRADPPGGRRGPGPGRAFPVGPHGVR